MLDVVQCVGKNNNNALKVLVAGTENCRRLDM
jgi:hypothetical protein